MRRTHRDILDTVRVMVVGKPQVIIAHTVKGKGVSFIEKDFSFHGRNLSPEEDAEAREEIRCQRRTCGLKPADQLRNYAGQGMLEAAQLNPKVVVLDGDLGNFTGAHDVKKAFPQRPFNIGIAEANMVGIGVGLASCGYVPIRTSPACSCGITPMIRPASRWRWPA